MQGSPLGQNESEQRSVQARAFPRSRILLFSISLSIIGVTLPYIRVPCNASCVTRCYRAVHVVTRRYIQQSFRIVRFPFRPGANHAPRRISMESAVVARDHTGHGAKRTVFDGDISGVIYGGYLRGLFTGVIYGGMAAVVSGHYGSAATTGQCGASGTSPPTGEVHFVKQTRRSPFFELYQKNADLSRGNILFRILIPGKMLPSPS